MSPDFHDETLWWRIHTAFWCWWYSTTFGQWLYWRGKDGGE